MEKEFILSIIKIIDRDLTKLEQEINLYPTEETIWKIDRDVKNSGGNLCLHLCGNLQHFIGAILGKTGYVRNRDNEFAAKGIARAELLIEIQHTKGAVKSSLEKLDTNVLTHDYPIPVFDFSMTTMHFLIHLTAHLEYHLGQVNYHRRLLAL
jgi:hypothetical protein